MSEWHNERNEFQYYVDQAHQARGEAMARVGYLAATAVTRVAGLAVVELPRVTRKALRAVTEWRNRQVALREILALDDRMLRDIGLSRADAWAAVEGTLGERALEPDPVDAPAYRDIALSAHAIAGCNDNGARRQAA
ncbi:MAG TPA: DUF1127 domain-containing protein [Candidatus Acidoferrum sp.]|nr:DUF1127 domain-containing protein [Candidatus Acidoferrum sp.]